MAGDSETAVMVMRMEEGLDTGPICLAEPVAIGPDMTAGELHDVLAQRGASLMVRALGALERGSLDCKPQPAAGASYAAKIDKAEARIDFARPPARCTISCAGFPRFLALGSKPAVRQTRAHQSPAHVPCGWKAARARCSTTS